MRDLTLRSEVSCKPFFSNDIRIFVLYPTILLTLNISLVGLRCSFAIVCIKTVSLSGLSSEIRGACSIASFRRVGEESNWNSGRELISRKRIRSASFLSRHMAAEPSLNLQILPVDHPFCNDLRWGAADNGARQNIRHYGFPPQ